MNLVCTSPSHVDSDRLASSLFPGFDPCSLFMSALASDIEDERRPIPSQTSVSHRPVSNTSYGFPSSQYVNNSSSVGQVNPSWTMQQQQQQQQYHYHEQPTTPQKQPRYPLLFSKHRHSSHTDRSEHHTACHLDGSSPRQSWNGTQQQQQPPPPQQYPSQIATRLDFSNQMQQPRLPPRQSSPSPQYPTAMNHAYPSTSTVTNNNGQSRTAAHISFYHLPRLGPLSDRWMNLPWTDPAIVSLGNKLDLGPSQWSNMPQSQGSSAMPSGNHLGSNPRWSQPSQAHMYANGMYMPYPTTPGMDDGSRP